jgi:hypothetical protein
MAVKTGEEPEMRSKFLNALALLILGFAVGFASGKLVPNMSSAYVGTEWRPLIVRGQTGGGYWVSVNPEVFYSDLPPGDVTQLGGRAKFLDAIRLPTEQSTFGYLINVTMKDPDLAKIPEKYKKEERIGRDFVLMAIEHVVYSIQFTFALKDKDGFELLQLVSKEETLTTGRSNEFQNTVEKQVPYGIARNTRSFEVSTSIVKCHTCKD